MRRLPRAGGVFSGIRPMACSSIRNQDLVAVGVELGPEPAGPPVGSRLGRAAGCAAAGPVPAPR